MRTPRRRKLTAAALAVPAAATLILWLVSHVWMFWYCSLPSDTQIAAKTAKIYSTKIKVHAGTFHYTDDATHERDLIARMSAGSSLPPGTMSLGTMYHGSDGTSYSGLSAHRIPVGFSATRWSLQLLPGNWGFPLAIPCIALTLLPAAYWLLTRSHPQGTCPTCRYDRSGLPATAPCPECGKTLPIPPA